MASVQQYLSVLAGAQSGANADAQRAAAQMQIELKNGDPRNAINLCMQLIARGQPLEARHFGYGVLQHVVARRWSQFTHPERQELAKLVYDKLSECGAVPTSEPPEPFMIKSKAATLMAEVVRQEGAALWSSIMPELATGACSDSPVRAELSALVMRYVAEDVAVYNSDIIGGRMKELLYGLTSTLPQALQAMYRLLEVHFSAAMNAAAAGNTPVAKAHAAAVSAALSAAAVYGEWAPLAPLMRSGVLDACCQLLSSGADIAFRAQACEVLRHVAHRRRGDTVNSAIASGAAGVVAGGKNASSGGPAALAAADADDAAREAAADAAAVVVGLEGICRGLGIAAQRVLAAPPAEVGSEEGEYARRLTETVATVAANHVQVIGDEGLRFAFLEALLGLTKHPRLDVLAAAIPAWPGLLRAMGAELPGTFVRPDKAIGSGVWGAQQRGGFGGGGGGVENGASAGANGGGVSLPGGAVAALLECARTWLQRGGGLASGLSTAGAPECKGDEWEDEYETRDELREAWIGLRARLMEVTKLCTALEPAAAAAAMAGSVTAVLGWVQPGGPLDPAKAAAMGPDGRSAVDDAIGSALEGCVSFVEPAMAAMPLSSANPAAAAAVAPALEGMLTRMLAVEFSSPVAVSQMSRLLESMGRTALVRPDAGTALLHRLFAILSGLPADDVKSPPARAKAAMTAGRTSQAARQRVCAAILGVCAAAPEVFNAHLEAFANQVDSLRSGGRLSGAERGALAEALLAVAGPSGPARVRDVLRWLLESVQRRWVPAPGVVSPDLVHLASLRELAKGEGAGGTQGLSDAHWELFHDVQLAERCLRRSAGDHDPGQQDGGGGGPGGGGGTSAANGSDSPDKMSQGSGGAGGWPNIPAGMVRPVDPPPPVEECPAADHLEWVLSISNALCRAIHDAWTPNGVAEAAALGLDRALCMSPEEQAAHLVHGPARTFALEGGGMPPASDTADAARNFLRGMRDSAYALVQLLSVHAPGAFYPNQAAAAAVGAAAFHELGHMHDRHARVLLHTLVRPVLGRCPAAHRPIWHAALTVGLLPHMHERLAGSWARVKASGVGKAGGGGGGMMEDDDGAFDAGALAVGGVNTGGGSAVIEDLIGERVTRDLARDHSAILELLAVPEGTFGRKTRGSGLTGHLRGAMNGVNTGVTSGGGGESSSGAAAARLADGGGRHVREWMSAVAGYDGGSGACARAGIATATAALTWGDSEAAGRALAFLKGIVAAAAAADGDQTLREMAGGEIFPGCLAGLTEPSNSAHQAELLGVIRDIVVHLLPVAGSVRRVLLGLPGMTEQSLGQLINDLAQIRSEKKAANRVKEMIVQAAGGGDALRAFAEARAGATSTGAIQVPNVTTRHQANRLEAAAKPGWTEEEVNAIGLNPLTANSRAQQ